MIRINDQLSIPSDELRFTASRGGGPGGQHVNKVASRVTLRFDVAASRVLSDYQRARIREVLASRLTRDGELLLSSHESRSQAANRAALTERFATLIRDALRPRETRRKTRPTRGSKERRVQAKKRRADVKRTRGKVRRDDG
ncbi:MAG: aminoacyl-tRNA hydrolase [Acidobacteria bacterium]|nr:aminoacyl-tRNA hydrolase [Acidobacteriota bacterium]